MNVEPCPFCGSENVKLDSGRDKRNYTIYFGKCLDCGSMGHDSRSSDEATEAWNRRAEQTCRLVSDEKDRGSIHMLFCSLCGEYNGVTERRMYMKYCLNCGARIIKEEDGCHAEEEA